MHYKLTFKKKIALHLFQGSKYVDVRLNGKQLCFIDLVTFDEHIKVLTLRKDPYLHDNVCGTQILWIPFRAGREKNQLTSIRSVSR